MLIMDWILSEDVALMLIFSRSDNVLRLIKESILIFRKCLPNKIFMQRSHVSATLKCLDAYIFKRYKYGN